MRLSKKSTRGIFAAVIIVSMITVMLSALQSCENDMDYESEIQNKQKDEIQKSTGKLVVYMTYINEQFLTPAINIFKNKYPEVEVEIVEFASEVISSGNSTLTTTPDEFRVRLNTELAAGQGPDLVLAEISDFPDIYKTMATGIFVDLNQFIENDGEFKMDEYVQVALDSGIYQGKRYIMPYEYEVPILITTQKILDTEGITPADLNTFDGFIRTAEKYKDNPDKPTFRNLRNNLSNLLYFFPNCGIDLIDYNTNTVGIDKPKFKSVIDIMKPMYMREESKSASSNWADYEGLRDQKWIFHLESIINNSTLTYSLHNMLAGDNLKPLYFKYPNIDNGVTANIRCFAAIPKMSKNQTNAYNLLKIILSEEIQTGQSYLIGNPVLKSAAKTRADKAMSVMGLSSLKEEKSIKEYLGILINVDSCKMTPNILRNFLLEEMKPYFEGKQSFEQFVKILKNKLEIYISE